MAIQSAGLGYLAFGVTNLPNTSTAQSISVWCRVSGYPGVVESYVNLVNTGASQGTQLGQRGGTLMVWRWGGVSLVSASANPSVNVWHNLIYTSTGSVHSLYIDGSFSNSNTTTNGSADITASNLFGNSFGESTAMLMEDVRIYNRALSAEEVGSIYAARGIGNLTYGLVSRLLFREKSPGSDIGAATSVKDISISANHGISSSDSASNYTYIESGLKYKAVYKTL